MADDSRYGRSFLDRDEEEVERMMSAPQSVSGAEYVRQLTKFETDRLTRSAFHDLVLRIAPPAGALFDFGAGPGIDARFFAERGYTVDAYDVDPKMAEYFAMYCRDFIDSGRITLDCTGYREFLETKTLSAGGGADVVISNFAPLSLIADLNELFAKFHALTRPNGKVLASVLNPYFIGDLRFPGWWRRVPRLWRDGHYFLPSPGGPVARRRLADFTARSRPYFTLAHVFSGLPQRGRHGSIGANPAPGVRYEWFRMATSRFIFLLFEKHAQQICTPATQQA
jgi:SAM-dependent methyltransferase